jgi:oligoribonuclease NrnB/cAMP/cGMP phosphodiesterase (DHH superfamily)
VSQPLRIHYHRDFDGMVSAAVLAKILAETRDEDVSWTSVNYDQRRNWESFGGDERFAIVDFHFHPKCVYWFDHHPTTFLTPELRAAYEPSDRWSWDETSPSCPPLILRHAAEHWDYEPPERFVDMALWSDIVDAARFRDVDQAIFGDEPALRIMRSMTAAPSREYPDELVEAMVEGTLEEVANLPDVEKAHNRAARNRDKALEQFPRTVISISGAVLHYDASSSKIRRERFAPFYYHPDLTYAVGVIPTRSGFHVTAGENPWKPPKDGVHLGELMEKHGGGGHRAVAGANPPDLEAARSLAAECAELLRAALQSQP